MPLCGENMSRANILLLVLNTLFAISGLVLLIEGIKAAYLSDPYLFLTDENLFKVTPFYLISAGAGTCLIAFSGYYAAAKGRCMIITIQFAGFLIIFFVGELAIGIAGCVKQKGLSVAIEGRLNETLKEYPTNPNIRKSFDIVQTDLQCCGVRGPEDWPNSTLPAACCVQLDVNSQCTTASPSKYDKGCLKIIQDDLQMVTVILSAVGLAIPLAHLIMFIIGVIITRSTVDDDYEAL